MYPAVGIEIDNREISEGVRVQFICTASTFGNYAHRFPEIKDLRNIHLMEGAFNELHVPVATDRIPADARQPVLARVAR